MFSELESFLLSLADAIPLPLFAPLASFSEEIIAPIPSGPVMMLIGSLAQLEGYSVPLLIGLACLAALGKTVGGFVVYTIADRAEDILAGPFAKFTGITHEEVEAFGKKLKGGPRDFALLLLLRTLPFVPSALVSIGAGILKVRMSLFIATSFLGALMRDAFYLYLGFQGIEAAETFIGKFDSLESAAQIGVLLLVVCAVAIYVGYRMWRKRRKATL